MSIVCPARDELVRFNLGLLADSPAVELATHVDSCANCRTVLEEISRKSDPLAAALRSPGDLPFAGEAALAAVMGKLQALGKEDVAGFEPTFDKPSPAKPLQTIRDYEVLEKLGQGGMGAVYKARHARLKKIVAIKILPRDRILGADAVARFEREMEAIGKLEHPHLVRAMDAGEADGTHFLVMEYVGGLDLSQLVKERGPLPIAEACELIRQAAIGLQHVHEQGLVHRDIKPSNLMLSPAGTLKILDLGLALLSTDGSPTHELTSSGQMMGTIDYMAPEQGGDTHHVDIRADIYSLGATLYKLLTGVAPFGDAKFDTPMKKLTALATQEPTPIPQRRKDIPPQLAGVIARMLAKSPADRFATPAEVVKALTPFASGSDLIHLLPSGMTTDAKPAQEDTSPSLKSASVDTFAPTIDFPQPSAPARRISVLRWLGIGAAAAALIVAALVLYIPTPQGIVKVTINDPSISVKFDTKGAVVEGADPKPIQLKFGEQGIVIKRDDFEFTTTSFKLNKKGETVLDIQLLPAELRVVYDGELIHRKALGPAVKAPAVAAPADAAPPSITVSTGPNYALEFDGATTHVLIPSLQPDPDQPLTIEALVKASPELKTASILASAYTPKSALMLARGDRGAPMFLIRRNFSTETSGFTSQIQAGRWMHVAGVWDGKNTSLYLQGKYFGTFNSGVTRPEATVGLDQHLTIGAEFSKPGLPVSNFYQGQLDEIRLSKVARYTQEFKPLQPQEQFFADEHTVALFHCDEGKGSELTDAAKGKHPGKIVSAKWARVETAAGR